MRGIVWTIGLLALVGCGGGVQTMPEHWRAQPVASPSVFDAPKNSAKLQILCAYGGLMDNHAALLLTAPDRPRLFWDPGGQFGYASPPGVQRQRCLIAVDAPCLTAYLQWRQREPDVWVEVFEWNLTPEVAQRLHQILIDGSERNGPDQWDSNAMGTQCSVAISRYLQRFARDVTPIDRTYRLPTHLSRWIKAHCPPDRVLAFRPGEACYVYTP